MSHSIVIADPSTVALVPAPIEPGWIVEGQPEACAKELARSGDGTSVVVAWSCTAGRFRWHYRVDETVPHHLRGSVRHQGGRRRTSAGAGRHGVLPGRELQHVAGSRRGSQARGVPARAAPTPGICVAGVAEALRHHHRRAQLAPACLGLRDSPATCGARGLSRLIKTHSGAPERSQGEPGIHTPQASGYGFRARRFAATRNDERWCYPIRPSAGNHSSK